MFEVEKRPKYITQPRNKKKQLENMEYILGRWMCGAVPEILRVVYHDEIECNQLPELSDKKWMQQIPFMNLL
mgnify:CR=1 FL=1